jgi:perosamine synthetase
MSNLENKNLAQNLIHCIRGVVGESEETVPLHVPEFHGRERELINDCIDSGWVSSVGSYVNEFETKVARSVGCLYGVAVMNGTAALQIALLISGVNPNDEVLLPALTFVATANATSYLGAIPHFVDSAYDTLGVCPLRLRAHLEQVAEVRGGETWNHKTGRRIAAIVPMHVFGCPVDMNELDKVLLDWPMDVVEDAAESLGSQYKGRRCGSLSSIAAISFNGNKIVTTGGGGAIVTNDKKMARRAKHLTTTAKLPSKWDFIHDEIGYNYRMPNLNAALGVAQLEQLEARLIQKKRLFDKYSKAFLGLDGVQLFNAPRTSTSNNWLITIILDSKTIGERDLILKKLNEAGIMSRPSWTLMHRLPMYKRAPRADLTQAEGLEKRVLNIPSSAYLGALRGPNS